MGVVQCIKMTKNGRIGVLFRGYYVFRDDIDTANYKMISKFKEHFILSKIIREVLKSTYGYLY